MRVVLTQPSVRARDASDFDYVTGLLRKRRFRGQENDVIVLPELIGENSSTPDYLARCAAMAQEFGLAASRGSDFHSPEESHTDLGALPGLPGQLTPVWELLADRIRPAA